MKIAIIDYKMGNLFSVHQACTNVGATPFITSDKKKILGADAAILPGVGAFGRAMDYLEQLDLIDAIKTFVKSGKQLLGICLGMQLLFSQSEEFGLSKGLDLIKGEITKFPETSLNGKRIKVPQIAWNHIHKKLDDSDHSPLKDIRDKEFMYFVHSFYAQSQEEDVIATKTHYAGIEYCSSVLKENIFATQFHPEKSAGEGMRIYQNWAQIIKNN